MKSLLGVLFATLLLTLSAPLLICTAVLILIDTKSFPIFRQLRIGQYDRVFTIYKFRTMTDFRDSNGCLLADEQRVTPLGRFLRRTSLDELPQLWNVLRGEIGLVGPRPLLTEYLPRYTAFQRRRHEVKPGITGWAQVNGRNSLTWEQRFDLDIWYVENKTPGLDAKILWMTLFRLVRPYGISQTGYATMPEFMGTPGQSGRDA